MQQTQRLPPSIHCNRPMKKRNESIQAAKVSANSEHNILKYEVSITQFYRKRFLYDVPFFSNQIVSDNEFNFKKSRFSIKSQAH